MKVLLVNPWIVDVAAYNFWVRPLGLYRLAEWLCERGVEVALVDCLSPAPAPGKFPAAKLSAVELPQGAPKGLKRYGIGVEEFRRRVAAAGDFDFALISTLLSWWYPGCSDAAQELRAIAPGAKILAGGVYPTLWPGHAANHSGADENFSGPLEKIGRALADTMGLPLKPITPHKHWWELGLHDGQPFQAVRCARGCPERCTYCASKLLSDGFEPRTREEITEELCALWALGISEVAFYDDALLVGANERLFPALEEAKTRGAALRFQTPNGLHARLLDEETARRMVELGFVTFRLSLETVNAERAKTTGGKVGAEDLARAVRGLLAAGAQPASIGVYLLMGLPGQEVAEVEDSIRFVKNLGVRPYLAEFSPIPGTAEWENAKAQGLVSDGTDPLWTNNSLYLTSVAGWEEGEVRRLKNLCRE